MPEQGDVGVRYLLSNFGGNETIMDVLDPQIVAIVHLLDRSRREFIIDLLVGLPVIAIELGILLEHVAHRPDDPVTKAIIVVGHLLGRQPDPSQSVSGAFWGDHDPSGLVAHLHICAPAPPGDPGPLGGLHHWVQGCHQSTGRHLASYPSLAPFVNIGLSIRH